MYWVDISLQGGNTSIPGLSSQYWREHKYSGQNCVANVELVRIGVDISLQGGNTSIPGLSSQYWREHKYSGQNCVVNVELRC